MSLKKQLQDDMKACMRAGEKKKLGVLRLALAAIKQVEVDERIELDDDKLVLNLLNRMIKQRRDSINQFTKAGRDELAAQEVYEVDIIQTYLPKQLEQSEITAIITTAINDTGANSMRDMGKVMGIIKPKLEGLADMSKVSTEIKALLAG